jgi:molybdate transport system ATP-binding protein
MFEVAITQRHGDFTLDTAFEAKGGVTALFGRSGAGKSSIINLLIGSAELQVGEVRADDDKGRHTRADVPGTSTCP